MVKGLGAALAAILCVAGPVSAATLSAGDTNLGRVKAAAIQDGLNITVDLGGDVPTATHIIARFQNNRPLMQGPDGLWAPWNGDLSKLDDVAVLPAGEKLIFQIFDRLPEGLFYPVSFTLVYRTAEGLKSGTLTVDGP
jgi:hypothetical protein